MTDHIEELKKKLEAEVPVYTYTRQQAIDDGVLVRVPQHLSVMLGFATPVCITLNLQEKLMDVNRPHLPEGRELNLWNAIMTNLLTSAWLVMLNHPFRNIDNSLVFPFEYTYYEGDENDKTTAVLETVWIVIAKEPPDGTVEMTLMLPSDY